MRRRRLWAGLATAAVLITVVTGWSQISEGESTKNRVAPQVDASSQREAGALLQAGIKQGEINDFAGAAATFKRVLDLDPQNKFAWYNLGVIAQHDNRTAGAQAAYDKALKIDPNFESALYNKAVLLESSDTDQAVVTLQRIVAANPKAATAYLHLGQDLAKKGQDKEAEDDFAHAVQADSSLQKLVPKKFRGSASAAPSPTPTVTQAGTNR